MELITGYLQQGSQWTLVVRKPTFLELHALQCAEFKFRIKASIDAMKRITNTWGVKQC